VPQVPKPRWFRRVAAAATVALPGPCSRPDSCDVDAARVCGHGVGVLGDGALVERVDLRHAGGVADVVGHLLEPGPRPSGEVDAGAGIRERTRHGSA
jgi:hypothetical protein